MQSLEELSCGFNICPTLLCVPAVEKPSRPIFRLICAFCKVLEDEVLVDGIGSILAVGNMRCCSQQLM